jgi:hypothetical protein
MTRNQNRNDWQQPASRVVKVINEETGVSVDAHVLSRSADRLSVAIQGNKVILAKNAHGVYVGKLLGMSLKCNG